MPQGDIASEALPYYGTSLNEHSLAASQFREQLQLHVQTIGILVAEKAELLSKLQQQTKKSDKKQEECDELTGRLKASRQKIVDMEKLITQLSETHEAAVARNPSENIAAQVEQLRHELDSRQLLVDELRLRLAESDERVHAQQTESGQLAQVTHDLKSQLEIMQLKMLQMSQSDGSVEERPKSDIGN